MSPNRELYVQPIARIAAHWKVVAGACVVALLVSLVATLLLPKRYTAVTTIYIESPAGSDPRAATTVSPIYLDSLRTYELVASSDSLFLNAAERFHLRNGDAPIDQLKRSILKVEVPRNTRILEIHATLRDAKLAHELALYLAQESVKTTENTNRQVDREFASDAERQYAEARTRMDAAQKAWDESPDQVSQENLQSEVLADEQLRDALKKELTEIEVSDPGASGPNAALIRSYRARLTELAAQITAKRKNLAQVSSHLETLQSDMGAARRMFAGAEGRLQELRSAAGNRGERLRIIDPGIVPERPSSPDLLLNLVVALIAAAILSIGGLLLTATAAQRESPRRLPMSIAAK